MSQRLSSHASFSLISLQSPLGVSSLFHSFVIFLSKRLAAHLHGKRMNVTVSRDLNPGTNRIIWDAAAASPCQTCTNSFRRSDKRAYIDHQNLQLDWSHHRQHNAVEAPQVKVVWRTQSLQAPHVLLMVCGDNTGEFIPQSGRRSLFLSGADAVSAFTAVRVALMGNGGRWCGQKPH